MAGPLLTILIGLVMIVGRSRLGRGIRPPNGMSRKEEIVLFVLPGSFCVLLGILGLIALG